MRRVPALIVMSGGVASGKSTLAAALAERLGVQRLEADRVRASLVGDPDGPGGDATSSANHEAEWLQSFESGFEERVYAALMARAEAVLQHGRGLVLDACFPSRWWRRVAAGLARRHGLPLVVVECRVDAATLDRRLAERDARAPGGGWREISARFESRIEPIDPDECTLHIVVDTTLPLETSLRDAEARLAAWQPSRPATGLKRPGAVTFDCWNTLLYEADWTTAHARRVDAVVAVLGRCGTPISRAAATRAFDAAWARHMAQWRAGIATGAREVAHEVIRVTGADGVGAHAELVDAFQTASHSGRVLALPNARDTLEKLHGARVRCAVICDTGLTPGRVVREHLARLGLLDFLEVQIFSDEAGVPKPDPRVFEAALAPLGVPPADAVHVGDLRRTDVAGARGVGMGTIRIRAQHDDASDLPDADATVDDHQELAALLLRPAPGPGALRRGPSDRGTMVRALPTHPTPSSTD